METAIMVIDQIHILQGDIFVSWGVFQFILFILECLSIMSCSFNIISFINIKVFLIKNIFYDYEVNWSVAAFIFHFV